MAHHETTIWLAGVTLGRELRARALSHTALIRRATAGELTENILVHEVACRQRPHSESGWLHRGHQLLSEDRVGRAVPGISHRVGPEWRGASAQ